jgi:hypothetical protein
MAAGTPIANFQTLFEAPTKGEAERLAGQIILDARQFGSLIELAAKLGYTHSLIQKNGPPPSHPKFLNLSIKLLMEAREKTIRKKRKLFLALIKLKKYSDRGNYCSLIFLKSQIDGMSFTFPAQTILEHILIILTFTTHRTFGITMWKKLRPLLMRRNIVLLPST